MTGAGAGVTGLAAGDLVALDNMMACGHCPQCRRARPQFCATLRALGVTDPGGFADFVVATAGKCHPAGDLDPEVAVFAEPVACVVHGLDVLALRPGSDVLVAGTGPDRAHPGPAPAGGRRRPGDRRRPQPVQAGTGHRLRRGRGRSHDRGR